MPQTFARTALGHSNRGVFEGEKSRQRKAVSHRSVSTRNAPYPRRNSGDAFETGTAKPSHPVENPGAIPGFGFLIFEGARLQLGPNNHLPTPHESFTSAALIVARGFLPGNSPTGSDFGEMAVSGRRVPGRIGAHDRVYWRWNRDLNRRSELNGKQIRCWFSIISSICQKVRNRAVNLITHCTKVSYAGEWLAAGRRVWGCVTS